MKGQPLPIEANTPSTAERTTRRPPGPQQQRGEDLFDLTSIHILWHRRWLILFCIFLFSVLGVFQVKRTTPIYTSEAILKYEPASGQAVDFGERSRIIYSRDELRTSAQLIRTPAVANAVLAALDDGTIAEPIVDQSPLSTLRQFVMGNLRRFRSLIVASPPPITDRERLDAQNAARGLLSAVSVSLRPDTRLLELRVSMSDPARAERVADEFCRQFILRLRRERSESFTYARDFLSQQIQQVRDDLERLELELIEYGDDEFEDYGAQADLRLLESDREIAHNTLASLNTDIERLRNEIALLEAEANPVLAEASARRILTTERRGTLLALTERRDHLLLRETELNAENSDDFLPLVRVRREIESLNQKINESSEEFVLAYVESRESALETAQQRLEALKRRLSEHQVRVNTIEQRMIRFRVMQRDIESTREIYNALLDRFKRLEITDEAAIGSVTIESPATIPTVPTSPNVTRILASFAGFGFLFGCGVVLLFQKLDRSVRDPALVEETLGLPALAHVPCLRTRSANSRILGRSNVGGRILAPFDQGRSQVGADAFRYLRTSINYSSADTKAQVLLVTSSLPSEGKSTVAANLGVFFAEQNRKVLLVDGDLKKPSVHKTFAIPRLPGLSDVLTGQAEFDEIVHHSQFEGYDVLPAGLTTPSPATLLESRAMSQFIEKMREQYDIIILDSSPAHAMADALVLAKICDGVILAVRDGHTPMDILGAVSEKLLSIGARILGVVYNSTETSRPGAQYGRYYGRYIYGTEKK